MQYVDEDSPSGSHVPSATNTTEIESTESETINDEFLNDDIFGDDDDEEKAVEAVEAVDPTDPIKSESVDTIPQPETDPTPEQLPAPVIVPVPNGFELIPEIVWDEEAEKRKDETAFFDRLRELNVAIDTAEENLDEAKEEAKLAKATLNLAIANQKHFTSKGVQYRKKPLPQPIATPAKTIALIESSVEGSQETKTEETKAVPAPIPESEWRAWETETILDGIEGLGAKKRETLIEHFPTFGKLMDARTEAGKEHVSFHSLLPKGIGESIATELINRMDAKICPGFKA
jgi:hypothetical protein